MPKNTFKLSSTDPRPIVIKWSGLWKNVEVSFDGNVLGTFPNSAALKAGQTFTLPDRSVLSVQLITGFQTRLEVLRDGVPLPGSAADPEVQLKLARGVAWFMGGLTLVLGVVAEVASVRFLLEMGVNWISAVVGAAMLVLGYFIGKRSVVALGICCGLVILDTVLSLVAAAASSGRTGMGGIAMRAFFLIALFNGFKAIKALKERAAVEGGATSR